MRPLLILLSVLLMASIAHAQETLSGDNVDQITELRRYGEGVLQDYAVWSADGKWLAVAGAPGAWLFDAENLIADPKPLNMEVNSVRVAWSPDSRKLAASGYFGVKVYDLATNTFQTYEGRFPTVFSPDGRTLAVNDSAEIVIYDLETQEEIHRLPLTDNMTDILDLIYENEILYVKWEETGGGGCMGYTYWGIIGWDMSQMPPKYYEKPPLLDRDEFESPTDVAFSLDGTTAAIGDYEMMIADVASMTVFELTNDADYFQQKAVFDGTGTRLAVVTNRNETAIFDLTTQELLYTLPVVGVMAYHPTKQQLVIDKTVWDVETQQPLLTFAIDRLTQADEYVVEFTTDQQVIVRDIVSSEIVSKFSTVALDLRYTRSLNKTLIADDIKGGVQLWSLLTGKPISNRYEDVTSAYSNTNGTLLMVLDENYEWKALLDTVTGEALTFDNMDVEPTPEFTPDGRFMYWTDTTIAVYDHATGEIVKPFPSDVVFSSAVFGDRGRYIIGVNDDTEVGYIWDSETEQLLPELPEFSSYAYDLDGQQQIAVYPIRSSSNEAAIRVWDLVHGKEIALYEADKGIGWVSIEGESIHYTADFECVDDTYFWNYVTGEAGLYVSSASVPSKQRYLDVSTDGTLGVNVSGNFIYLYDVESGEQLRLLEHWGRAVEAYFSDDGSKIISRGDDGTVRVWGIGE